MARPGEILVKGGDTVPSVEVLPSELINPSLQVSYKRCDGFNEIITGTSDFEICTTDPSATTFDSRYWKVERIGPCDGPPDKGDDENKGTENCKRFTVTNTDVQEGGDCKTYDIVTRGAAPPLLPLPLPIITNPSFLTATRVLYIDCTNTGRIVKLSKKRGAITTVCSKVPPIPLSSPDEARTAADVVGSNQVTNLQEILIELQPYVQRDRLFGYGPRPGLVPLGACGESSGGESFTVTYTDSNGVPQTLSLLPGKTATVNATDAFTQEIGSKADISKLLIDDLGTCQDIEEDNDTPEEDGGDTGGGGSPGTGAQILKLNSNLSSDFKVQIVSSKISSPLTLPVELEGDNIFQDCGIFSQIGDAPVVTDSSGRFVNYVLVDVQVSAEERPDLTQTLSSPPLQDIDRVATLVEYVSKSAAPTPKTINVLFILEAADQQQSGGEPFGNTDDVNRRPG